jgi:hypothetical protein
MNFDNEILGIISIDECLSENHSSSYACYESQAISMIDDKPLFILKGCISLEMSLGQHLPEALVAYMDKNKVA